MPPPSCTFLKKLLNIAMVLFALAIVGLAAAAIFLEPGGYRPALERAMSAWLGQPVEISGPIHLSLFPSPGLSLENISIGPAVRNASEEDGVHNGLSAQARKARLLTEFWPLLSGALRIKTFEVEDARIVFARASRSKDVVNNGSHHDPKEPSLPAERHIEGRSAFFKRLDFDLTNIDIRLKNACLIIPLDNDDIELTQLDLAIKPAVEADQHNFSYRLKAVVDLSGNAAAMEVAANGFGQFDMSGLALSTLDGHFATNISLPPQLEEQSMRFSGDFFWDVRNNLALLEHLVVLGDYFSLRLDFLNGKAIFSADKQWSGSALLQVFDQRLASKNFADRNNPLLRASADLFINQDTLTLDAVDLEIAKQHARGSIRWRLADRLIDLSVHDLDLSADNIISAERQNHDRLALFLDFLTEQKRTLRPLLERIAERQLRINADITRLRLPALEIERIKAGLHAADGRIYVHADAAMLGGEWDGTLITDLALTGSAFKLKMRGHGLRSEKLAGLFNGAVDAFSGPAELDLSAAFAGANAHEALSSLQLEAKLALTKNIWTAKLPGPSNASRAKPVRINLDRVDLLVKAAATRNSNSSRSATMVNMAMDMSIKAMAANQTSTMETSISTLLPVNTNKPLSTVVNDLHLKSAYAGPAGPFKNIKLGVTATISRDGLKNGYYAIKNAEISSEDFNLKADGFLDWQKKGQKISASLRGRCTPTRILQRLNLDASWIPAQAQSYADFEAHVDSDFEKILLPDLRVSWDNIKANGSLDYDPRRRPLISARIKADKLDLDRYLPPATGKNMPEDWHFPLLKNVDLKTHLQLDQLIFRKMRLSAVTGEMQIADARISLTGLKADYYGGQLAADLTIIPAKPEFRCKLALDNFNLQNLLTDMYGINKYGGKTQLHLDLGCYGNTPALRMSTLHGQGRLLVRNGYSIRGKDFYSAKELAGTISGRTNFNWATATFNFETGTLFNQDFRISGPGVEGRGKGWLDMAGDSVDYSFLISYNGLPGMPVRLHGRLSKPTTSYDAASMLGKTAVRIITSPYHLLSWTLDQLAGGSAK